MAPDPGPESRFVKKVTAGRKTICLVREQGELYALGSRCPHAGGDLTQGWCSQGKLVCPVHRYAYDLRTGKGNEGQHDFVITYPLERRADGVYVGVRTFWERVKEIFS